MPRDDHAPAESHAGSLFVLYDEVEHLHPHAETSHTEHGLTFLVEGSIRMHQGTPLTIAPGSFTVVPAGLPHRPLEGRGAKYWLLGFCATCLGLDEGQVLMSPFRRVRHGALGTALVAKGRRRNVIRLFDELAAELERGAPESPELTRALVVLLLGELRRAMPSPEGKVAAGSLVAEALEYIQRHCLDPISLEDVARAVHRTPAHVTSSVKKATGYSVGQWIGSGRVAEAAARLAHTDDSLDEIAHHVGWQDKTHFIRQFKKHYGSTPAAWRRAQRHR